MQDMGASRGVLQGHEELVWYAAYGSNTSQVRLQCYLTGGKPPGGQHSYPGARDPRPPRESRGVVLPGSVYFALESRVWGGGMALWDPDSPGEVAAVAHLITCAQLVDIQAQEMLRIAGGRISQELSPGARIRTGEGRYDLLVCTEILEGHPVVSFTSCEELRSSQRAPSASYLRVIMAGLREGFGWSGSEVCSYLEQCEGIHGVWEQEALEALCRESGS